VSLDRKKLDSQLPPVFHLVLDELVSRGFILTLVGGSVRDFFLFGALGKDWDVELSHATIAFNKNDWKDLGKKLSDFGKVTFLPYDIIRLNLATFEMEFSPPRLEHFHKDSKGHSNFEAEFNLALPFEEAIKRRDFTINAMGIRFNSRESIEFLDPLQGLDHLRGKILHPAGDDFAKDPVRFLRALRFSIKYNFVFSNKLKDLLFSMKVESVTPAYLWSEMLKSRDPLTFLMRLLEEKKDHPELRLPLDVSPKKLKEVKKNLFDPTHHESWIIALEWASVSCESWNKFFGLSSESSRRLARWASSCKEFQGILPEHFHGEFEEVRDSTNFEKLFNWYFTTKQLLQKNPELPLLKMIEDYLPAWIHLYKFEPPKDVKHIDPPFRAKYQVWNLCQRL
jgi:hypothetical protein